jgi:hypothetical protein
MDISVSLSRDSSTINCSQCIAHLSSPLPENVLRSCGTHRISDTHTHPFPHYFFQYNSTGPIRRSHVYDDEGVHRIYLCYHLHCMKPISPGCMYCAMHKKMCTKCAMQPRMSRNGKLCASCSGKPVVTQAEDDEWIGKDGERLIHPTRYKQGRCETCGPRVTFVNYRDSSNDVWVTKNKQCLLCYQRQHPSIQESEKALVAHKITVGESTVLKT